MSLNPKIWGPHYWFVLHTIALTYPLNPNETIRKKYYDLMINFHLFLPNPEIGNKFSELLNVYPVTPYLDSRKSFIKWMHFIHNKINISLGKKGLSFDESLKEYYNAYKPLNVICIDHIKRKKKLVFFIILIILIIIGIYLQY